MSGSNHDAGHLRNGKIDPPGGSVPYDNRTYTEHFTDAPLAEARGIELRPRQKKTVT